MKFITARRLSVGVSVLLVATSACQRAAPPNANLRSLTNASRHRVYAPTERDLTSARATMLAIAEAAQKYFRLEQLYSEHVSPLRSFPNTPEGASKYRGDAQKPEHL